MLMNSMGINVKVYTPRLNGITIFVSNICKYINCLNSIKLETTKLIKLKIIDNEEIKFTIVFHGSIK